MAVIDSLRSSRLGRRAEDIWARDPAHRAVIAGFLLLAVFMVMNAVIHLTAGWSALATLNSWLTGTFMARGDSWNIMIETLAWWRAHPDELLYKQVFFEQQIKFQYFPTSLLPLLGLEAIGLEPTLPLLNGINNAFAWLTVFGMGGFAWILTKQTRPEAPISAHVAPALFTAVATIAFYPVTMALYQGQLQVWMNAFFVLACIAWVLDRRVAAGVLVGLICLLKPQFGLFALWALLRRDWRLLAGLAATGVVGLAISLPIFGLANHLDYLSVLSFLSRHGESYLANFSFNGLLHHVFGNDAGLAFEPHGFPPFHPLVYAGTLVTSLAILAVGFLPARKRPAVGSVVDFQRAALAFTLASPIAWEHHYGVAAPMLATLFCHALTLDEGRVRRAWLIATAIAYAFIASRLQFTDGWTSTPLNVLQSYTLFAGLAVLVMLLRLSRPSKI